MSEPLKLFITYSHKNTEAKDELITHLAVLKRENRVTIWHDNKILPGDKWREAISNNLTDSDILLYLVSADSLASTNCNKELSEALELAEREGTAIRTIPIILESCDWKKDDRLSEFQALPDKGSPINEWQPESKGWQSVVDGIRKVVDSQAQTTSTQEDQQELLAGLVIQQGNFLLMLGQVDKAIEAYSHAIKVKQNFVGAYNNRGVAYGAKGDYDRAIQDYTKAIDLKPDDAAAYNNRGNVYGKKDDHDRAIQDYTKAIDLKPDDAAAYNNRGNVYGKKDDHDHAIQDYDKAIDLKPDLAAAYYNLGVVYGRKGDHDHAIQDYDKAIALRPDDAAAYNNCGLAYGAKGDYDHAIEDYTKAIDLNPDLAEAYYMRGVTWSLLREWDKARSDLTAAKERGVPIAEFFSSLYGSVSDFEQKSNVQLPDGIKEMLTP